MRIKTIYKEIDRIYQLFLSPATSDRREALVRLANLREKLRQKVEEKEVKPSKGKQVQGLLSWYLRVWNNNPPEYLRMAKKTANSAIAKNLKELLEVFEGNEEKLKEEYLEFKTADEKRLKWEQRRLLWDKGIFNFRKVLPKWKQLKEEEVSKARNWGAYDKDSIPEEELLPKDLEALLLSEDSDELGIEIS